MCKILPITSTPCSLGGSHATFREEQVEARMPRLDGASGGRAVLRMRLSDLAVKMKALTVSLPTASGSEIDRNHFDSGNTIFYMGQSF